jgi:uncharacterized protein
VRLAEIHIYPLKGARGISLERADVLAGGLRHDRRFMVLAADGTSMTQRAHPRLALVATELGPSSLTLATPASAGAGSGGSVTIPLAVAVDSSAKRRMVHVTYDDVEAVEVPGAAAELLSDHFGERCTLVFMPDDVVRPVETPYGKAGDRVGFADAYPVLLATLASLADLNARLDEPVRMNRFRANLIIEGGSAFDEERYGRVRVGAVDFRMPKRCARCQVTVVDQETASVGKEPLRTLASYRKEANKVYFAQNLIPDVDGPLRAIAVGDDVTYYERD